MIDIVTELRAHGFEHLSEDMQRGLLDAMLGAVDVYVRHANEPGHGDTGWREQDMEMHAAHADIHIGDAYCATDTDEIDSCATDDDGLPHIDHATARIGLYYARRRMMRKR